MAPSVPDLQTQARRLLDQFFGEFELPTPEFKIVDQLSGRWLGRTTFSPKAPDNTTIEMQKRIMGDPKTMERILLHELIHHADFLLNFKNVNDPITKRLLQRESHGKFFREEAARINRTMGEDFVTEKSDKDAVISADREFYVLVQPYQGHYGYNYFLRPTAKDKEGIKQVADQHKGKLFKVNDRAFLTSKKPSFRPGNMFIPREEQQALRDKLKELYEGGKQVALAGGWYSFDSEPPYPFGPPMDQVEIIDPPAVLVDQPLGMKMKTVAETESFLPEDLVMVDCEMTGVVPDRDKLLQIAMTKLKLQGNQYVEYDDPLVIFLKHDGAPQNKFHKQYLMHVFEACNKSQMLPEHAKEKIHQFLGPLKGKVTPTGDCVPTDIDFMRHAGCIDAGDIGDDGPIPGTFHYEYFDMNGIKALARHKAGKKEDTKDLAGFDQEGIHDALIDCRNQTCELNHYMKILIPPAEYVPHATSQIEALTKEEIKKEYAGKTSFLYYPVNIPGETDEHHITVKFFDKVPITPEQIEEASKGIEKLPPRITGWKPVVLNGKKGDVKVLELTGLSPEVARLHYALETLRKDDYPDYRPHVTVSDELWEKIKAEKLKPTDLGVTTGPLTFEAMGKIEKVFSGFSVTAKFETAFESGSMKSDDDYVEVFRNPSAKELRQAEGGNGDVRAFLDGDDLLVWNALGAIHASAARHIKLGPDPIPLVIYFGSDGISAQVTDYSKRTKWHHNPEVAQAIDNHPWIKRLGHDQMPEISYYDEAIVGPWCELEKESVEAAVQVAFLKQPKLWDGKAPEGSRFFLHNRIYVVDTNPVQWVVEHLDMPESTLYYEFYEKPTEPDVEGAEVTPTLKSPLPTELPDLFFENYRGSILFDQGQFRTYEVDESLQNFILRILTSMHKKIPSFRIKAKSPAVNKMIQTQAFLKSGIKALSSILEYRLGTQGDVPYFEKGPTDDGSIFRMTETGDNMPYLWGEQAIKSPTASEELRASIVDYRLEPPTERGKIFRQTEADDGPYLFGDNPLENKPPVNGGAGKVQTLRVDPGTIMHDNLADAARIFKDKPDGIWDDGHAWLAKKVNGEIVGGIEIMEYDQPVDFSFTPYERMTRIGGIFIAPAYRRQGIGKELLLHLIRTHKLVESNLTATPEGDALWKSIKGTPGIEVMYRHGERDYGHLAWVKKPT